MDESIPSFARPRGGNEGASAVLSAVSSVRMFSRAFAVLLSILPDYFLDISDDFLVFTENQNFLTPPRTGAKILQFFLQKFLLPHF